MFSETTTPAAAPKFASHAEARAIVDRARALRAAAMGRMLRAALTRLTPRHNAPHNVAAPTRA